MHSLPDSPASHGSSSSSNFYGASDANSAEHHSPQCAAHNPDGELVTCETPAGAVSQISQSSFTNASEEASTPNLTGVDGAGKETAMMDPAVPADFPKSIFPRNIDLGRKRKRSEELSHPYAKSSDEVRSGADDDPSHAESEGISEADVIQKRQKVTPDLENSGKVMRDSATELPFVPEDVSSRLPTEVWQYIFSFVPPASLGRLLRVNKAFNKCLSSALDEQSNHSSHSSSILKVRDSEVVWRASRQLWCPGMPRPLSHLKEIDMWRLVCGRVCQFCCKVGLPLGTSCTPSPWAAGPGDDDVRVIWAFSIRACGKCLMQRVEKELDIILSSSTPSFLLPALPFALITPPSHVISPIDLQSSSAPAELQMAKYYLKSHLEDIKVQFEEAQGMGTGAAEEFMKGLRQTGLSKMDDAARWEKWDHNGGLRTINSRQTVKRPVQLNVKTISNPSNSEESTTSTPISSESAMGRNAQTGSPAVRSGPHASLPVVQGSVLFPSPLSLPPRPSISPSPAVFQGQNHGPFQPRTDKTIRDVNEVKALRRSEIERRCMELDPPIPPNLLSYMESFQAATQIATSLTDSAWEVLKPRLLAQREVAERRESEHRKQTQILQAKAEERRLLEAQMKETKEALDREWEESQKPIRDRISLYADEIIHDLWQDGKLVTKETAPKFAAEVLMHVRQKFYADMAREGSQTRSVPASAGDENMNAPTKRILVLENMKWIFDTKIKPITEQLQKELFLCNGCENIAKFYGFEGVVQHYAAKHTSTLSRGSVVVHWRAEWPETPPFHPHPSAAKAALYRLPTPAQAQANYLPPGNGYPYSRVPEPGSQVMQHPPGYPNQGAAAFNGTPFPNSFARQSIPFEPSSPLMYQSPVPSYHQLPSTMYQQSVVQSSYAYPPPPPPFNGPNYETYRGGPPPPPPSQPPPVWAGSPYPPPSYLPGGAHPPPIQYSPAVPAPYGSAQMPSTPSQVPYAAQHTQPGSGYNIPAQSGQLQPTIYKVQLEELAKNARDIWNSISGIKDLPGSIRIFTVIHHVNTRFKAKFANEPSLAIFTDGLTGHHLMKPIKNLHGLACKACVTNNNGFNPIISSLSSGIEGNRKLFTLPSLLSHFQSLHIEHAKPPVVPQSGIATPRLDWKVDMVELPEEQYIAHLIHAQGMDDEKLSLIAAVFPGVFPFPLPKLSPPLHPGPTPILKDKRADSSVTKSFPSAIRPTNRTNSPHVEGKATESRSLSTRGQHTEVSIEGFPRFIDSPYDQSGPTSEPGEDEYDPHRPAYIEPIHTRARSGGGNRGMSPMLNERFSDRFRERPIHRQAGSRLKFTPRSASPHPSSSSQERRQHASTLRSRSRELHREVSEEKQDSLLPGPQNLSEDGEVEETPKVKREEPSGSPSAEMTAAENFLNSFTPGKKSEEFQHKSAEREQLMEEETRTRWRSRHLDDETNHDVGTGRRLTPTASGRLPTTDNGLSGGSLRSTPVATGSTGGRAGRNRTPKRGRAPHIYDQHGDDRYDRSNRPSTRPLEHSPEPINVRTNESYSEDRHSETALERHPRDRFASQRFREYSSRSRSPEGRKSISLGTTYYRERSSPIYRQIPQKAVPRRHPEEPMAYSRVPPDYRYVDDPRYYEMQYGRPVEYVPVRFAAHDPQDQDAFVVERRVQQDIGPQYVPYDDAYGRQPVLDPQYYKAEPRYYEDPDSQISEQSKRQPRY